MARFSSTPAAVPPPSTTATAARAATPAEQPATATATVPKPSTPAPRPAATAAPKPAAPKPAAPKSSLPAEYQTIASRNIFDSSAPGPKPATTPSSYEDFGQSETVAPWEEGQSMPTEAEVLFPYLQAVSRVAELRRSGQTGNVPSAVSAGPIRSNVGTVMMPTMVSRSAQSIQPNPKNRATPLPAVGGFSRPASPTREELDVPMRAAAKAEEVDMAYQAARADYRTAAEDIRRKEADPYFPRSQFPELAKQQRERLARVAELAAARREYGLKD